MKKIITFVFFISAMVLPEFSFAIRRAHPIIANVQTEDSSPFWDYLPVLVVFAGLLVAIMIAVAIHLKQKKLK